MNFYNSAAALLDEPQLLSAPETLKGLGSAGMAGYAFGAVSIFLFLRMFSSVPPGIFSFFCLYNVILALNFFFAAGIHLFLEMTGAKGNALRLFSLFGFSEAVWTTLLPLGFCARFFGFSPVLCFAICLVGVIILRISIIRRIYSISRNKALLSLWLPYVFLAVYGVAIAAYATVYLVWLII